MHRFNPFKLAMAVSMAVTVFAVAENPQTISAHHPLVTAEVAECIRPDATTWVVDLRIASDDPSRGKLYSVVDPKDYQPSGWVDESIEFIRTVMVPVDQASYTETVTVSWVDGPTAVTGTAKANRPPSCPQEPSFVPLAFCEEAGGTNGPVPLVGTANGEPVSFEAGETLIFPLDADGKLHLVLKDGDTTVFDQVLSALEGAGCDFSASFSGAADCDDIVTGTLTVNPDGYQAPLYYRVNGGEWVAMTGNTANVTGASPFTTIEVGDGESVLASATIQVDLPDECVPPPPVPTPKPGASITPPTCLAGGTITLSNTGTAPAEFTLGYQSVPAGSANSAKVMVDPGESSVIQLNLALGQSVKVTITSGDKTLVDQIVARPANCSTPQLPATGVGSWLIGGFASLMLLIGGLLVSVPRKWRKLPSSLI